jgi:hypothetical protein
MDRILAIDRTFLKTCTEHECRKIFSNLYDSKKESVSLVIESGNKKSLFYNCPHCGIEGCIEEEDENKYKKIYNTLLSNYVHKYVSKDKDGIDGVINEFLCYCPYCLLSSSALNVFQEDTYL